MSYLKSILCIVLLLVGAIATAQELDSLQEQAEGKLDAIGNLDTDTLGAVNEHIDAKLDSLTSPPQLAKIDSITSATQHKIDSLSALNLPTDKYQKKLDSLINHYPDRVKAKLTELQSKSEDKIMEGKDKLTQKLEAKDERLASIEEKLPDESLANVGEKLPETDIPGVEQGDMSIEGSEKPLLNEVDNPLDQMENPLAEELDAVSKKSEEISSIPEETIEKQKTKVNAIDEIGKAKELKEEAVAVNEEVAKAKEGDWEDIEQRAGEEALDASGIEGFDENKEAMEALQKEMEEQANFAEKYQNEELVKQRILEKSKYVANDVLSKYKEQVAAAQLDLLKYKPDSISLGDSLAKYKPHALKDKSFRNRLKFGLNWEITRGELTNFDVTPIIGFQVNTKLLAWAGYMLRVNFNTDEKSVKLKSRTYGPRISFNYDVYKGFYTRATGELLRVNSLDNNGNPSRSWLPGLLIGLGKDYKIGGLLNGDVHALYNVLYSSTESPYPKRFNIRFGFYINSLKKQQKPAWKQKLKELR